MITLEGLSAQQLLSSRDASASTTLRFEVLRSLGDHRFEARIGGKVLRLRSTIPLVTGRNYRARIEQSGTTLILRLLSSPATDARGLAAGQARVMAALMREGLAGEPRLLAELANALERAERPAERARILAQFEAKGIRGSAERLNELATAVESGSSDAEGRGSGEGERRPSERGLAAPPGPSDPAVGALEDIVRDLEAALRNFELAAASPQGSPLALSNHLPNLKTGEYWVRLPLELSFASSRLEAELRVKFDRSGGYAGEAALSIPAPAARTGMFIHGSQVTLFLPSGEEGRPKDALRSELAERLAKIGYTLAAIRDTSAFDGFSADPLPDIMPGIDTSA